ncbi:MAG: AAA family ATPase [Desulfobaccales bacterium]
MRISIKDFLRIESLNLDLQVPINIIVGENEAGKSSIRDALRWCLTGEARGLKTHQQQAALIRDGGKAAEVKTTLPDGSEVFRKKTPKSPPSFSGAVPEDAVMAAILCDPLTFLCFPGDKRRELMFRLLPGLNPTRKEIADHLIDWLAKAHAEEPIYDVVDELAKMAATKGFKDAENEAIIRRQTAKRLREENQGEKPNEKATIGGKVFILPDTQEAEVQEGLAKLQTNQDQLFQKKGLANGELDKLSDLEKELEVLEGNPVVAPKLGEINRLQSALEASQLILADLREKVDALTPGIAPKLYPATCPAFPGSEMPCPKAGEMAISGQKAPDPAKPEKLQANLEMEEEKEARLEEDLREAHAKQAAYEEYPKQRQDLAAKVAEIKEQSKATTELDQQIAVLDARMQIGHELLDAVRTFWREKDAADTAASKLEKSNKEAILYDALAKALSPEGIPSRLIAEALKPVNDQLQVGAAHLFPGRTLTLSKDLEIELSGSPYVTLSKSAKFRVGVAFQCALARLAGARLLMIDEADILDPRNRGQLINLLLQIQRKFDTILVFATSDHARAALDPDIQLWVLLDGKIYPLNRGFRFEDGKIISEAEALEKAAA